MRVGLIIATILLLLSLIAGSVYPVKGLEYVVALYVLYLIYEFVRLARPLSTAASLYILLLILSKKLPRYRNILLPH